MGLHLWPRVAVERSDEETPKLLLSEFKEYTCIQTRLEDQEGKMDPCVGMLWNPQISCGSAEEAKQIKIARPDAFSSKPLLYYYYYFFG